RILSVAGVAGGITETAVVNIAQERPELLGVQPDEDIRNALPGITIGPERVIPAPKPDILAAAMVVRILNEAPETAAELIWAGIEPDVPNGLNRVARLSYDAEIVLGMHQYRISEWFAGAVQGRRERCETLRSYFSETDLPIGWISAAVSTWRTLLDSIVTEGE